MNNFVKGDKKGMLLASEVLKIVLAVISITFLIYLLFSIYYAQVNSQRKEEAESTMERIKGIITRINNAVIESERITDISPASWNFFSFVGGEKKPNFCAGESCICICDEVIDNVLLFGNRQISECDDNGVCFIVSNLNKFESFEIEKASNGGTNVQISKLGENIEVTRV
ncbi:MAG: hypothetical protein NUV46_02110 [Nanoarchaeota archaeon]|nr:hypothetical protein [Nanoarchaeota archaeon]